MFGSSKKKSSEPLEAPVTAKIQVMPADFYAGANPVVTFKNVSHEVTVGSGTLSPLEKKLLHKETAAGSGNALHPATFLANPRFFLLGGLALLVLVGGGVGVYYWLATSAERNAPRLPTIIIPSSTPEVVLRPISTSTVVTIPSSTINIPPVPVSLADQPLTFPSMLLGDSPDTDKDGLTDREEELFTTELNVPDTDNDSYADSHELFYLYNPAGKEPMKLIDSGLAKEYRNLQFDYTLYYPSTWAVGDVDGTGRDVLFSTITGENIEVRVFDKAASIDFDTWFQTAAPDQKYSDLVVFESYFKKLSGFRRKDSLVHYFPTANHVYVIIFKTTDSNVVNFRSVATLLARSFSLNESVLPSVITPFFSTEATSSVANPSTETPSAAATTPPVLPGF